ncbi:MAG: hypothetical protein ACF8Q5_01965 [Phycisphaerales bacterium JB040]
MIRTAALCLGFVAQASFAQTVLNARFTEGLLTVQGRALDPEGVEQRGDLEGVVNELDAAAQGRTSSGLVGAKTLTRAAIITEPTRFADEITYVRIYGSATASQPAAYGGFANLGVLSRALRTEEGPGPWTDLVLTLDTDAYFRIDTFESGQDDGLSFVDFNPVAGSGAGIDGRVLSAGDYTMRVRFNVRLNETDESATSVLNWRLALREVPSPGALGLLVPGVVLVVGRRR